MTKSQAVVQMKVGCVFTAYKISSNGEKEQYGPFNNLVTDYGLDSLADNTLASMMTTLHVGTGSTTPANSDTSLTTELVSTTNTIIDTAVVEEASGYWGHTRKFQFTAGQATGDLTELGLSGGGSLFNHALFRDIDGNTITVTVASDEIFEVMCEMRVYHPVASDNPISGGPVTIDGTDYYYDFRFTSGGDSFWLSHVGTDFTSLANNQFSISQNSDPYSTIQRSHLNGATTTQTTLSAYTQGSFELIWTCDWDSTKHTGYVCVVSTGGSLTEHTFWFGFSPGANEAVNNIWAASTGYSVDEVLIPSDGFGYAYKITAGGTSAGSAPTWPTTVGDTVTDANGVTYECIAPLLYLASDEGLSLTVKLSWGR